MAQASYPPMPARRPSEGPGLGISLAVLGVGIAIAVASFVAILVPLVGTFTSRQYLAPIDLSLQLRHSHYTIYEYTGQRSGVVTHAGAVTLDPSEVSVTAPDGEPVEVFRDETVETTLRGSSVYTGALVFDAPASGTYDVKVEPPLSTSVVIVRSIGDAISSVAVWFGTGALGAILVVLGIVMLVIGSSRRGRARHAPPPGWGQPAWGQPGWGQPAWGQPAWGQQWGQPPPGQPPGYPPPGQPPGYPPPGQPPGYPPPPPPPPPESPPVDPWAPPHA